MYIGIDIGGTNIAAGIVKSDGTIVHSLRIKTKAMRTSDEILEDIKNVPMLLCKQCDVEFSDIEHIGIGVPGSVNKDGASLIYANNLQFINT